MDITIIGTGNMAVNTTFAGTLVQGDAGGQPLDVFVASDDDDAKRVVRQLSEDGGMRVLDAGPLSNARQLEGTRLRANGGAG
jgi:8-hydroxy-5-deazaflavin:NADPH oxidoreductase